MFLKKVTRTLFNTSTNNTIQILADDEEFQDVDSGKIDVLYDKENDSTGEDLKSVLSSEEVAGITIVDRYLTHTCLLLLKMLGGYW